MASRTFFVALALCLVLADPASSSDLTGTWRYVAFFNCTYRPVDGGVRKSRENVSPPLAISQIDGALTIDWGSLWTGHVFWYAGGTGHGVAYQCDSGSSTDTMEIESARTFPEDARGISGRMVVSYRSVSEDSHFECKRIEFERIDTENPNPPPCP